MAPSILKMLRALADEGRLRLLLLLQSEELNVAEMQEILNMGQSRISMQLKELRQAGLVEDRKTGKSSFYRLHAAAEANPQLRAVLTEVAMEMPEARADQQALELDIIQVDGLWKLNTIIDPALKPWPLPAEELTPPAEATPVDGATGVP